MPMKTKPPIWFWIAAVLLLLWSVSGVAAFHMDLAMTRADMAKLDAYDQKLYTDRPVWFMLVYGVAVWAGLIGSALMLVRRRWARGLYIASLVAVIVMFGRMFFATDIIAVKGAAVATGFPIVIALIAAGEVWLAGLAIRRGWIG